LKNKNINFQTNADSGECLIFQDPDGHWLQIVNPSDFQ